MDVEITDEKSEPVTLSEDRIGTFVTINFRHM